MSPDPAVVLAYDHQLDDLVRFCVTLVGVESSIIAFDTQYTLILVYYRLVVLKLFNVTGKPYLIQTQGHVMEMIVQILVFQVNISL